ncbi:uncharacterized protein EKO05_0011496 [Ascochyta rabiei]|uniref:Uncharacterized protein n=1 Tax=Didymella rabiei TaxID=5454 RepID=A0A163AM87_DIDRA|nr:uncharacterized protein EKO05_0011496 [Ascochyta rabiei]KZM21267.1 hypothetical protein ST47_g7569 [Ascochyta rabiei]UPX21307.1 hypothetical protein EKO05_0011496 [Ascochyta rabiei]
MSWFTTFPKAANPGQDVTEAPPTTVLEGRNEDASVTAPVIATKSLMDLPLEIREMIWHLALENERHVPMILHGTSKVTYRYFKDPVSLQGYRRHTYQDYPPFLPAICRLSAYTRAETIKIFLRGTTFGSSSTADNECLTGFLGSVPGGFASIRGLYFDCFGLSLKTPRKTDLELAVRCTCLRELTLLMHEYVLARSSAQDIYTDYNFNRLLDSGSVGKVSIITVSYCEAAVTEQAARDLAFLIEDGFRSRGRTVQVTVN